MATRNDVTGQEIKSRTLTDAYANNWDAIFGKKKPAQEEEVVIEIDEDTPRQE